LFLLLCMAGVQIGYSQSVKQSKRNATKFTLFDENGNKVGQMRRSIWKDTFTLLDESGNKTGEIVPSRWDENRYFVKDEAGNKTGEIRRNPWNEDNYDVYNTSGKKTGTYTRKLFSNEWVYKDK